MKVKNLIFFAGIDSESPKTRSKRKKIVKKFSYRKKFSGHIAVSAQKSTFWPKIFFVGIDSESPKTRSRNATFLLYCCPITFFHLLFRPIAFWSIFFFVSLAGVYICAVAVHFFPPTFSEKSHFFPNITTRVKERFYFFPPCLACKLHFYISLVPD